MKKIAHKFMKQLLILSFLFTITACVQDTGQGVSNNIHTIKGETMGTYYQVRYAGEEVEGLQSHVDSLLRVLDFELSTYNPKSVISRFNQNIDFNEIAKSQPTAHFIKNFTLAREIYEKTSGFFDPSVMPLVNYWGFGYDPEAAIQSVDSSAVDSLLQWVGFNKIIVGTMPDYWSIGKQFPSTQIDFSAIAKGYGVDEVAHLLEANQINNYLVDIGGEVVGKGYKSADNPWHIGIAVPLEEAAIADYMTAIPVENTAIATSGNYRNFHEIGGVKYSHTINPFTGFPERSRLLSASIKAADCATADAFATACMVAGLDKAFEMINNIPYLEGFFIYSDEKGVLQTKSTSGFPQSIPQNQ